MTEGGPETSRTILTIGILVMGGDPTKMTCEEFAGLEKDVQPEVA